MTRKIKLTENQIQMLQNLNTRKIKITETQLNNLLTNKLFEGEDIISDIQLLKSNGKYFLGRTRYNPRAKEDFPYSRDSSMFDSPKEACVAYKEGKYSKTVQESESILEYSTTKILGNPCSYAKSSNVDEVNSPSGNITKTFRKYGKSLSGFKAECNNTNEPPLNESLTVDLLTFAQEIIGILKDILSDSSQNGLSPIWQELGVSRGELFSLLADFGLISVGVYNGSKKYKVIKVNLKRKIKKLYDFITKEAQPKKDIGEASEQPDTNKLKVVYMNKEISILNYKGKPYFFYYSHLDKNDFLDYVDNQEGYDTFEVSSDAIENYVNSNIGQMSKGSGINGYESGDDIVLIDNQIKSDIIGTWGDEKLNAILSGMIETTTSGSSGAFSAPISVKN